MNSTIFKDAAIVCCKTLSVMKYTQKQTGWIIIVSMFLLMILSGVIYHYSQSSDRINLSVFLAVIITLSTILFLFYQLTINIEKSNIQLIYGIGLIRFNIKIDDLQSIEVTKTPWYFGLGIRFSPDGMIYNMNSLKAIRIAHKRNDKSKSFYIGTPTPELLKSKLEEYNSYKCTA